MQRNNEKGFYVVALAISIVVVVGLAGMAIDLVTVYTVKSTLRAATDAAVVGAARSTSANRSSTADSLFAANFPSGFLNASSVSHTPLAVSGNTFSMSGTAVAPAYFSRVFGMNSYTVNAYSEAEVAGQMQLIILDEDALDNGTPQIVTLSGNPTMCGNQNSEVCVNDDIANPSVRTQLFSRGLDIRPHSGLVLPSGQVGDYGWFRFQNPDPQISQQNGAQFTTEEFVAATGSASNENNLDKITDVIPLAAADLQALVGKTICAVVYDSDVSLDLSSHYGSLNGATLGITAFTVVSTAAHPSGGSYLPNVTVNLLSGSAVTSTCDGVNASPQNSGTPRITLKK